MERWGTARPEPPHPTPLLGQQRIVGMEYHPSLPYPVDISSDVPWDADGRGGEGGVAMPPNHCLFVVVLILKELRLISASYLGRPKSGTESHFVTAYILSRFAQVRTPSRMPPASFQAFATVLLQPGRGQIRVLG